MKDLVRRLFYVPKCASCGVRLPVFVDKDELNHGLPCFCSKCVAEWHRVRTEMCQVCGKPADECSCMPKSKVFAQPTIPSLFFYRPDSNNVPSRAIYTLKHKRHADLIEFFALELSPKISELLCLLELSADDCIFTYIPRTPAAIRKNGFDQGELLAKRLCAAVGGERVLPLLTRKGGKEQKRLSRTERRKNADSTIFANVRLRGVKRTDGKTSLEDLLRRKPVVLIDDVITAGASVCRGVKLLKSHGAKCVIVASIARCEVNRKTEKAKK